MLWIGTLREEVNIKWEEKALRQDNGCIYIGGAECSDGHPVKEHANGC